jgi:hypothetical protein
MTMELKKYVQGVLRTESDVAPVAARADDPALLAALNVAIGQFVEAGDTLDKVKRQLYYGKAQEFPEYEVHPLQEVPARLADRRTARLFHAVLGMCTEAAELLSALDAHLTGGEAIDELNVFEEFGDCSWYWGLGTDAMGFDPDAVLEKNIAKLRARYPDKFDAEAAVNRDLDAEKRALQG